MGPIRAEIDTQNPFHRTSEEQSSQGLEDSLSPRHQVSSDGQQLAKTGQVAEPADVLSSVEPTSEQLLGGKLLGLDLVRSH